MSAPGVLDAGAAPNTVPGAPASPVPAGPPPRPDATATSGRVVEGTVRQRDTGHRLSGAVIEVAEAGIRAASGADGSFTLTGLPPVAVTLVVTSPEHSVASVRLAPDATSVMVELALSALEEIIVVGRATQLARKNVANAITKVDAPVLQRVTAQTVADALQGKVAGANIQANSGAPGGGIQLKLRGVSTINGRSAPLYVLDGVILSDAAIPSGVSAVTGSRTGSNPAPTQDNQVNRIADLNPADIESVEVLKGASAAAIYGAKASNGVVILNTRHGEPGEPRVHITQRLGMYQLSNKLGTRRFETSGEAVDTFGERAREHYTGRRFDHEAELAGRNDLSRETVISLGGGTETTGYYASFVTRRDAGVIVGTGYGKDAGRLSLRHHFGERLTLRVMANVIRADTSRGLTNNDNLQVSHYMVLTGTPSFFDLRRRPDGTYARNPFVASGTNPLQTAALMSDDEEVWRVIAAVDGELSLWESDAQSLSLAVNGGLDRFQQKNDLLFPPELFFEGNDGLPGTSIDADSQSRNLNLGVNLVHRYRPAAVDLEAYTSAGFQFEERDLTTVGIVSRNLTAGQPNVDAGTQIEVAENRERIRDRGFYLQEEVVALNKRLTVVGAVRAEQSGVNGDPTALFFYPKAATAYRLPGMPSLIDDLKLRLAYGETGNQPLYGQRFTSLNARVTIEGNPGLVTRGVLGAPDIRPERQRELEGGFDLLAYDGRLGLEVTVYDRTVSDLLLQRTPAPSTGYDTAYLNGGRLRNRGLEVALTTVPVRAGDLEWTAGAVFALNRSKILDLPVPAFTTGGFGASVGAFRIEEGASATQIVGNNGLNEDGTCCRVEKLGDVEPDFRVGFSSSVAYGDFSLAFLLDWQQGSDIINLTRFLYDGARNSADYETAGRERNRAWGEDRLTKVYVEDATFLKLREVVLAYELPSERLGVEGYVERARVSVSGRNLLTLTSYSGLDPEVSNFGNQPIARNIDVAPYPPSRSFWVSLELGI